jgi:hypothetical protein
MRASLRGRDGLVARVQQALGLFTKKGSRSDRQQGGLVHRGPLLNNLGTNGFTLKLNSFGKFSVRYKPGILRKIPFTGETKQTKTKRKIRVASLGMLRQSEPVD